GLFMGAMFSHRLLHRTLIPGVTLILAALTAQARCSAFYDLIIRNGRILDGTGAAPLAGDIAIRNGRIAAIGTLDTAATAPQVIDAQGQYVAPGFIDVHTHCEGDLLDQPEAANFIRMGVTTLVTGNCGGSYINLDEAFTSHTRKGIAPN